MSRIVYEVFGCGMSVPRCSLSDQSECQGPYKTCWAHSRLLIRSVKRSTYCCLNARVQKVLASEGGHSAHYELYSACPGPQPDPQMPWPLLTLRGAGGRGGGVCRREMRSRHRTVADPRSDLCREGAAGLSPHLSTIPIPPISTSFHGAVFRRISRSLTLSTAINVRQAHL